MHRLIAHYAPIWFRGFILTFGSLPSPFVVSVVVIQDVPALQHTLHFHNRALHTTATTHLPHHAAPRCPPFRKQHPHITFCTLMPMPLEGSLLGRVTVAATTHTAPTPPPRCPHAPHTPHYLTARGFPKPLLPPSSPVAHLASMVQRVVHTGWQRTWIQVRLLFVVLWTGALLPSAC